MGTHFHEGELSLQKKYNIWHDPKVVNRILKHSILPQLVPFIEQQTTVILSTLDDHENIWASMLIGANGFVKVITPELLHFQLDKLKSASTDMLFKNIGMGTKIGILFIDTATRTRYRINGRARISDEVLKVDIIEAYPNCPKYIQQRVLTFSEDSQELGTSEEKGFTLTALQKDLIKEADTFFLGSMNANGDLDASHRGGKKGFIEILENGTLKVPDYPGNNLFNTLGNFVQYPKAGLLFVNFEKGHSLQLTGATELLFDMHSEQDMETTGGTGRYWLFKPEHWVQTRNHNKVDWKLISFSPFNP